MSPTHDLGESGAKIPSGIVLGKVLDSITKMGKLVREWEIITADSVKQLCDTNIVLVDDDSLEANQDPDSQGLRTEIADLRRILRRLQEQRDLEVVESSADGPDQNTRIATAEVLGSLDADD